MLLIFTYREVTIEFYTVIYWCHISLTVRDLGNASEHGIQGVSMSLLLFLIIIATLLYSTMYKPFLKTLCWYFLCFFQLPWGNKHLQNNHPNLS